MTQSTYMLKKEAVKRNWHLIDANDQILGQVATRAAVWLQGKHKPEFTPHVDAGDYVVVINAAKVALTGKKETNKIYTKFSGYPGGIDSKTVAQVRAKHPERLIEQAVYNMLPGNKLRTGRMLRLKVYAADQHPHTAQLQPQKADK